MTLDESLDTVHLTTGSTQDMLELYQLRGFSPTELHVSAIYGKSSCIPFGTVEFPLS